jgi:hypothetical protein
MDVCIITKYDNSFKGIRVEIVLLTMLCVSLARLSHSKDVLTFAQPETSFIFHSTSILEILTFEEQIIHPFQINSIMPIIQNQSLLFKSFVLYQHNENDESVIREIIRCIRKTITYIV